MFTTTYLSPKPPTSAVLGRVKCKKYPLFLGCRIGYTQHMPRHADIDYDRIEAVHYDGLDWKGREIYVVGEPESAEKGVEPGVEFIMAGRLIKNLRLLTHQADLPILIHMKTCGGYWEEGLAMMDAIAACPCYVTILSYTHARSMSSMILQAADNRLLMPHSYFLFHRGESVYEGEHQTAQSQAEWEKKSIEVMLDIYTKPMKAGGKYNKFTPSAIRRHLMKQMQEKNDVYLTAPEAVEWGLADAVFDGNWEALC